MLLETQRSELVRGIEGQVGRPFFLDRDREGRILCDGIEAALQRIVTLDLWEPHEFKPRVAAMREATAAVGRVSYEPSETERGNRSHRRSLFVVKDVRTGETFSEDNVRSVRPANGLPPRHWDQVIGRRASRAVSAGTPLSWDLSG